jgi:hypothetical protein
MNVGCVGMRTEELAPLNASERRERGWFGHGSPLSSMPPSVAEEVVVSTSSAAAAPADSVSIGKPSAAAAGSSGFTMTIQGRREVGRDSFRPRTAQNIDADGCVRDPKLLPSTLTYIHPPEPRSSRVVKR